MKQIGQFFYRNLVMLVMVLLVVALALPVQATAAATTSSDDFNTCSYDTNFWSLDNPAGLAGVTPVITGMYTGNATMSMTVPAGTSYTFSADNTRAPRLWHTVADGDLNYKVKFMAPFQNATDSYKIMGFLVRDNTTPSSPKYFRFDFNVNQNVLRRYEGYLSYDASSKAHLKDIVGVSQPALTSPSPASGPLYLTVQYTKATSTWNITYQVGDSGTPVSNTFTGTTYAPAFTVTDIGLFVASTVGNGTQPSPGATMVVDYVQNLNDTAFTNDAIKLTVEKTGAGTGNVNWPTQCVGNQVTLQAVPALGSVFAGWGGAASGTTPTTTVTMDASKTVTATFNSSGPITIHTFYLPDINSGR